MLCTNHFHAWQTPGLQGSEAALRCVADTQGGCKKGTFEMFWGRAGGQVPRLLYTGEDEGGEISSPPLGTRDGTQERCRSQQPK